MSKLKFVFSSLVVGLMTVGCICLGLPLSVQNFEPASLANETVTNNLQPYVKLQNNCRKSKDFVYLMTGENNFSMTIADDTVTSTEGENFAYIPNDNNKDEFYYFDFNTIALYYNVTNDMLDSNTDLTNLLTRDTFTSNCATSFVPPHYSFKPEKFNMSISLQKNSSDADASVSDDGKVTVNKEGAYTLSINADVYHTTNGGQSFEILSEQSQIHYTFMIFDYTTYYNNSNNRPNTEMLNTIRSSALNNTQSQTHSMYYFYNYSKETLPQLQYNPNLYEISIRYINTDNLPYYATVKFDIEKQDTYFLDENGNRFDCDFFYANFKDSKVQLTFNNLGTYEIIYNLVYTVENKVYDLPIDTLNQRLYIYGYQIFYTDLGTTDPDTNTTVQKEFKQLSDDNTSFDNAADITSKVINTENYNPSSEAKDIDEFKNEILDTVKTLTPATTNQAPIKFKSNILPKNSKIYTLQEDGNFDSGKSFDGGNINIAGTYLIITEYTYSNFAAINGLPQTTVQIGRAHV